MSIARCGRRSFSICCRTPSNSPSRARSGLASPRGGGRGAARRGYRHRHSRGRAAPPVRALPSHRGRARPDPRGHRDRSRAGAGARQAAQGLDRGRQHAGPGQHFHRPHAVREPPSAAGPDRSRRLRTVAGGCSGARGLFVAKPCAGCPSRRAPTSRRADAPGREPARGAGGRRQRGHAGLSRAAAARPATT